MTDTWTSESAWCWEVEKWALGPFAQGQVVIHRASGEAVRLVDVNGLTGYYRLDDGRWVEGEQLEDPLREGRLRDLAWAQRQERRREAVERGDFGRAFPSLLRAAPDPEPDADAPVLARLLLLHAMIVLGLLLSSLLAPRPRPHSPAPPPAAGDRAPAETSAADSGP